MNTLPGQNLPPGLLTNVPIHFCEEPENVRPCTNSSHAPKPSSLSSNPLVRAVQAFKARCLGKLFSKPLILKGPRGNFQ